jgi:hypothetical protein
MSLGRPQFTVQEEFGQKNSEFGPSSIALRTNWAAGKLLCEEPGYL